MKKFYFIGIVSFLLACKPVNREFVLKASYGNIKEAREDSVIIQMYAGYKAQLDSQMNEVIGYSDVAMIKGGGKETLLGNFTSECVWICARNTNPNTDFCVLNNGGLRASLPQGNITIRNIFELMPFDNEVVIVEMKGYDVKKIFEYIVLKGGVPVSGLTIKIGNNDSGLYADARINGILFDETKTYRIATSDYLAGGGDNMGFFASGAVERTGVKIRDAIIQYIRLQTDQDKKLEPVLDGRISELK